MSDNTLTITYNNLDLKLTHGEKVLGVNIDENLVWNSHFQLVVKKSFLVLMATFAAFTIFVN